MRSLATTLLLMLMLPGLLLPAGLVLRICRCDRTAVAGAANGEAADVTRGCCSASPRPTDRDAVPARPCCCQQPTNTGGRSDEDGLRIQDDRCSCLWLTAAEREPGSTPPAHDPQPAFDLPLAIDHCAPVHLAVAFARRQPNVTGRPPPDRQRTLPLLI